MDLPPDSVIYAYFQVKLSVTKSMAPDPLDEKTIADWVRDECLRELDRQRLPKWLERDDVASVTAYKVLIAIEKCSLWL